MMMMVGGGCCEVRLHYWHKGIYKSLLAFKTKIHAKRKPSGVMMRMMI
jgi:hypothetical protein